MTLTTHAITGAAIATLTPSYPLLGFFTGFLSHFLLDAIPHWDYSLNSMKKDENNPMNNNMTINMDFLMDLLKIGTDAMLGLLIILAVFGYSQKNYLFIATCGAIGAMTPDLLQFVYMKWRHEPLIRLQKFHLWIHAKTNLNDRPISGILFQTLIILVFLRVL